MLARRAKLLGLWAAGEMGLSDADAYAKELVMTDMAENGDEDIFRKVRQDFDAKGVARSDHHIRQKMDELLATAKGQLMNEEK